VQKVDGSSRFASRPPAGHCSFDCPIITGMTNLNAAATLTRTSVTAAGAAARVWHWQTIFTQAVTGILS
jgi:hypothetical protein